MMGAVATWKRRILGAAVMGTALGAALALPSRADYVEVRRSATIKDGAAGDAAVVARPPVGTNLPLAQSGQTNGYYLVTIPPDLGSGVTEGFIYRTLVRGFPGDPPGSGTTAPVAVSSSAVYQGIPINELPEFAITVLDKGNFVVGYSDDFRNPAWVSYHIGPATDFRAFPSPSFRTDAGTAARVRDGDYTNSGFDRGHMAPKFALGSRFGAEGARSTFIMSNVAPQYHTLNDGQWGDLEEWIAGQKRQGADASGFVRGWADELGGVWVTVGPLFEEERDALPAGVPVPSAFFCIVVDEMANGQPRALAFIMPHVDVRVDSLTGFLKSIDEIETRAGLDFFHELPSSTEDALEAAAATALWPLPVAPN